VLDASVFHTGAKVKDAFLCRTRAHAVTQRTLYVVGVYEEELVGPNSTAYTTSTAPYTSYYSFGGKLVGMRRANYSGTNVNGQFRMVSDHLGSSTLLVNAAATPVVVSREYHKPYGEVAWSGGSTQMTSLTSIGYTGQRSDTDSGLMYYGARYYDPILSQFVSGDLVVADANNPKDLHKYLYVRGNPLINTDPTGLCTFNSDGTFADPEKLDCTVQDFDNMTATQRVLWVIAFQKYYNLGTVFNGVIGAIMYFELSSTIDFKPGSWMSIADAWTLAAMQDGMALYKNKTPVNFKTLADQRVPNEWRKFYALYEANHRNFYAPGVASQWGRAEMAGVYFGVNQADKQVGRPGFEEGMVIDNALRATDIFRLNLIGMGSNPFPNSQKNTIWDPTSDPFIQAMGGLAVEEASKLQFKGFLLSPASMFTYYFILPRYGSNRQFPYLP
jgi:RHS repeat-associated protein